MSGLVLSLFPGIGLLDIAFEEEGFCVVRGPDLLWGGDIRRFHPPAGKFDGVIGGPPCRPFSPLARFSDAWKMPPENLIPEFERCVDEAAPSWFVMENVTDAPEPNVSPYIVRSRLVEDAAVGGVTRRVRRFSFGTTDGQALDVPGLALFVPGGPPATSSNGDNARGMKGFTVPEAAEAQGLPSDFLERAPFTQRAKRKAIANGVPLPMGRAVAKAVKRALGERVRSDG